jgi:hypothetical protein
LSDPRQMEDHQDKTLVGHFPFKCSQTDGIPSGGTWLKMYIYIRFIKYSLWQVMNHEGCLIDISLMFFMIWGLPHLLCGAWCSVPSARDVSVMTDHEM